MSGSSANGYKEFLKHLGIDPTLMADDMRSRLPDSEKHRVILTTKAQKSLKGGVCTCSERGGEMKKKVIYIESFARITTPSLTGKILYHFADLFIVQWKELLKVYPKAKYFGGIF